VNAEPWVGRYVTRAVFQSPVHVTTIPQTITYYLVPDIIMRAFNEEER